MGANFSANTVSSLFSDYDTEVWSVGVNSRWKGIDLLVATIHGYGPAFRIGYNVTLLY